MSHPRSATIVINNHDYGRFLGDAIESALGQSWADTEVIVVDDGSRDESRAIIARYAGRVSAVLKENGGQASALNAGFARSTGDAVIFLDADDTLYPDAVERALPLFHQRDVVKVHSPLDIVGEDGVRTGGKFPDSPLPDGDHRAALLDVGPTTELSPPTSGNMWSRAFLARVLPIPESLYRISADKYLMELAPFLGIVRAVRQPLGCYRIHGGNSQAATTVESRLARELAFYDNYAGVLREHLGREGIAVDLRAWQTNSWWHKQQRALAGISALPRAEGPLILVDDASWGVGSVAGRCRLPFLEHEGQYWGQPNDDDTAIRALERLRRRGASFVVFVWATFWWLEFYSGLHEHLRAHYPRVVADEYLVAFDLRSPLRVPRLGGHGPAPALDSATHD
jgi:glycosyltransferase involved in cell wall biosynthesis